MSRTFEEMKAHEGHDVALYLDDGGDMSLYCEDCEEHLETWEKPPEPPAWQGQRYYEETGDEPDIGDAKMENADRIKGPLMTAKQFCNIVEAPFREGEHD